MADETEDDLADDSLFVKVALSATPFSKFHSPASEDGQKMKTNSEAAEEDLENDEDNQSTAATDDEIVIRLSGFTVSQNYIPTEVANGVLKQSVQGTTDRRPNQSKVWFEHSVLFSLVY